MRALPRPRIPGFRGQFTGTDYADVEAYYAMHRGMAPTPLRPLPGLAALLNLQALSVKDETQRSGVNAFKIAGVRYAVHRLGPARISPGLACATAGNHGRAVARVARENSVPCTVFVPAVRAGAHRAELLTRTSRLDAMRADGASVIEIEGSYESAVRRAAEHGETTGATIVSDTAWPGYEEIPRWIMAGYTHLFEEASTAWARPPDVVFVQGGVGGLVCAAVSWFAWRYGEERPRVIACEPESAACLLESAAAGQTVSLQGPLPTIMAGLRCGEPSPAAWPAIRDGIDGFVAIDDHLALEAMERLRVPENGDAAIAAGPSGACGIGALLGVMRAPELAGFRSAMRLDRATHALAVITEGP